MNLSQKIGLKHFRKEQPYMAIKPSNIDGLILEGNFLFNTKYEQFPRVDETYKLRIVIPNSFPYEIPEVEELEKRIPRDGKHHINPSPSNTLCLGSPIKLLELLKKEPTLNGFINFCLVPFLYAITLKIKYNEDFIFGELAHGVKGIIDDYIEVFGVNSESQVKNILMMLSLKKRIANKLPCPCECGERLGKCLLRFKINKYRKLAPRSWYSKNSLPKE